MSKLRSHFVDAIGFYRLVAILSPQFLKSTDASVRKFSPLWALLLSKLIVEPIHCCPTQPISSPD